MAAAYRAEFDSESCTACGVCLDRCQMEALEMVDGEIVFKPERCIGCGLCVTTCPSGALTLSRKPEEEQPEVPRNMYESGRRLARARGKLNPLKETYLGLKSKVDRPPGRELGRERVDRKERLPFRGRGRRAVPLTARSCEEPPSSSPTPWP